MSGSQEEVQPIIARREISRDEIALNENRDTKNVQCCGTKEGSSFWWNATDNVGIVFAGVVWVNILFALTTVILMYTDPYTNTATNAKEEDGKKNIHLISNVDFLICCISLFMVSWCHLATCFGDPGSVPWNAHPTKIDRISGTKMSICGHCDSYKPPGSHHDRVSGRCISRMDHFCPWMNNAIGAGNQKNFLLFLIYTGLAAAHFYVVVAYHLMRKDITYPQPLLNMTRCLLFLLVFTILFTISMVFNQYYGIQTGFGTIDRMKLKPNEVVSNAKPIPLSDIFGSASLSWFLPLSPVHEQPEAVFRYCTKNYRYGKAV